MSINQTITRQVERFEQGRLFSYQDFRLPSSDMEAMAVAFSRLVSKGIIKRYAKGKYFKPKEGMFGEVQLMEDQILASILKVNGKATGYLTGSNIYNQMGLTTQIANQFTIACDKFRKPIQKGRINIRFVKAYSEIIEKDIPLLQLLDAVKDINRIPGTDPNTALELIKNKFKGLPPKELNRLACLALRYPPSTRALAGAILETLKNKTASEKLYKSLNFLSQYNLRLSEGILPNQSKWNIKHYPIEKRKQERDPQKPDLKKLRRVLFWDTKMDSIDWINQKEAVIKRVFERGNQMEKNEIARFYGNESIFEILKA